MVVAMLDLAEQVFSDFECAINLLEVAEDPQVFRVLCVAAASLNRDIGYALQNDDDPKVVEASRKLYSTWKADDRCIFNKFIVPYRNKTIHETDLSIELAVPFCVVDDDLDIAELFENDDLVYVPWMSPDGESLDIRDWFRDSCKWWRKQINRIWQECSSGSGR